MPLAFTEFNDEMASLVESIQKSLVQITGEKGNLGAGTLWRPDGLIITNAHVLTGRRIQVVLSDGRVFEAQVLALDEKQDLAALRIEASDLPVPEIGDSRAVRAGQWVVAVGHPFGVLGAATAGMVVSAGDAIPEFPDRREWLALNLRLRPGHSGGPLIDVHGRMIGVNTLITGPEIGYAIPVHQVREFLRSRVPEVEVVHS